MTGSINILLRDYVLLTFYSMYLYVYRVLTSYILDVHSHVWHMGLARPQVVNKILLTYLLWIGFNGYRVTMPCSHLNHQVR